MGHKPTLCSVFSTKQAREHLNLKRPHPHHRLNLKRRQATSEHLSLKRPHKHHRLNLKQRNAHRHHIINLKRPQATFGREPRERQKHLDLLHLLRPRADMKIRGSLELKTSRVRTQKNGRFWLFYGRFVLPHYDAIRRVTNGTLGHVRKVCTELVKSGA